MPSGREPDLSPRRVVVVGAGLMGRWHSLAVRRSGSHIVAIVDQDADLAGKLAKRYGGLPYRSLGACLERETVDIAHICTPTETHEWMVRECINAGVSAFVEKPFSVSATSTAALIDAATKQGVRICPTHQYAFQKSVADLVGHLPKLGALATVDLVFQTAGGGQDKTRWARIAGDILPHPLSILQKVFFADDIAKAEWCIAANARGTWQLTARIQQALVRILLSIEARPTCARATAAGVGGTFEANLFHDYGIWSAGHVSRLSKISGPGVNAAKHLAAFTGNLVARTVRREPAYPGLIKLVSEFHRLDVNCIPITPGQILQVARIRDWFLDCADVSLAGSGSSERDWP